MVIDAIRTLAQRGELPRDLCKRALDGETALDDLAMDSLGKLGLFTELEDRADVGLSEGMMVGLLTLADLAQMLVRARGGR